MSEDNPMDRSSPRSSKRCSAGDEIVEDDGPSTVEGWDSLANIRIVHELETRFGVRLPDDALLEEQSVGALKRLVAERRVAE